MHIQIILFNFETQCNSIKMEQKKEKVFVNGMFIKTQKTTYGDIIKVSCKVEDVVAFLQKHQNEGGWCDIDLLQKQQVDEKGRTHTAVLNDWKPSGQPAAKPAQLEPVASDNDLPF